MSSGKSQAGPEKSTLCPLIWPVASSRPLTSRAGPEPRLSLGAQGRLAPGPPARAGPGRAVAKVLPGALAPWDSPAAAPCEGCGPGA